MLKNKLAELLKSNTPLLAAAFDDKATAETIQQATGRGMDVAELRIDRFAHLDRSTVLGVAEKFEAQGVPTLATVRARLEGGEAVLSEAERLAIYLAVIPEVDAVDIELSSQGILAAVVGAAHRAGKLAIISFHDFEKTPAASDLNTIFAKAVAAGADIVKIAAHAAAPADIQTLAQLLLAHSDKKLAVIAMGEQGILSRVFFPALGSCLTFAHMGEAGAPGQLELAEMAELLKKFYPSANF